ncbi:hypothetical protein [Methanobacterium alcaliphilum]|uniref:hypothetical protein n=1 Tax=Methanobacterium alcaliphilum TaxID=392018 RepID=UPI00200AFAA3|nr:hypothetical protein [Methanobacterium alcaliphilum]MCK9150471.1 hypothetical protein [Methanobacterium alcaliphilum]
MKKGSITIILGCICVFTQLLPVLHGDLVVSTFILVGGIMWIVVGVYQNKGYHNKNYFVAMFSIIALYWLVLLYIFLFGTDEYLENIYAFYILMGLSILFSIHISRYYIRRRKDGSL